MMMMKTTALPPHHQHTPTSKYLMQINLQSEAWAASHESALEQTKGQTHRI
jgi:hypothetical protein